MPLILTLNPRGGGPRETRTLTDGALAIGRGTNNDWVLTDPDRQLSKTHCTVGVEGSRFVLTDLSTNGVYLNGAREPTGRDSKVYLVDGDEFRIGGYSITVTEVDLAPQVTHVPAGYGGGAPPAGRADPFGGGRGGGDPFGGDNDDPFGSGEPGTMFKHPVRQPTQDFRQPDPFDSHGGDGLDDFGLGAPAKPQGFGAQAGFAGPQGRHFGAPASRAPASRAPASPLDADDDLFRGITPVDNWQGPSQPDNVDAPNMAFKAPKPLPAAPIGDIDFDALLGDDPIGGFGMPATSRAPSQPPALAPAAPPARPVPQAHMARAAEPPAPALQAEAAWTDEPGWPDNPPAASAPVARAATPPQPQTPPEAHAAAAGAGDAAALMLAFLQGAGIPDVKLPPGDPTAQMRAAGEVFRTMVEGLREVLMSRAAIKNEMRVEQTMLRARDNNALKFSVTPEEAVAALLLPNRAGYKPPLAAAREAFRDIQSHEMAVMAGVQTALIGLLKRFDPAALEKRLAPGRLDSILPAARKARIWELFCATYTEIAKEAEDDFQSVFGREFAKAYDAQMKKL